MSARRTCKMSGPLPVWKNRCRWAVPSGGGFKVRLGWGWGQPGVSWAAILPTGWLGAFVFAFGACLEAVAVTGTGRSNRNHGPCQWHRAQCNQQSTHLTMSAGWAWLPFSFGLKGLPLGIYDELGGDADGVESSMGMLAIGLFNIAFFYFWIP